MTSLSLERRPPAPAAPAVGAAAAGWWVPGPTPPTADSRVLREAVHDPAKPLVFVRSSLEVALADGGTVTFGAAPSADALPLLAYVPAVTPDRLGDPTFRADH